MSEDWILQIKETSHSFSRATWVTLRESNLIETKRNKDIGYVSEFFGCGSIAFPPENREIAEKLSWSDIGQPNVEPCAYEDGYYSTIDQYQYHDKKPIGVHLVFELPRPVVGGKSWILNPDLIAALRLIKEGANWVRPEENFVVVVQEICDKNGETCKIQIKREFLLDYLAARNLSLRLSYYRQRVENVDNLIGSSYANLQDLEVPRNEGRFKLLIRNLNDVFGGSWGIFRFWRNDIDEDDDAPIMGPENDDNTDYESSKGHQSSYVGVRVESEFWRDEWIDHQAKSIRIRGDVDVSRPQFIVETDGSRMASIDLDHEDIGRWLWFRSSIVNQLLNNRSFLLVWYTADTGAICSTSGYKTHFGINSSDLITVYAKDIARLDSWEQHIWAAHNVAPDGKVSKELLESQVNAQPASTYAVEEIFFRNMRVLETRFLEHYGYQLFTREIDDALLFNQISRFISIDQASLLRLAKELICVFSDRLHIGNLRKLSIHKDKKNLGSNKLLQDVLAQKIGDEKAQKIFAIIVGAYDMRVGDAHPTGSKIVNAIRLAGVNQNYSFLKQGEQLIHNFGRSIGLIFDSLK